MTDLTCYQCGVRVCWLAPDSRCGHCTRFTSDELIGAGGTVATDSDDELPGMWSESDFTGGQFDQ